MVEVVGAKQGQELEKEIFDMDIPVFRQPLVPMCGYTSFAMVMAYCGYPDINISRIYEHLQGVEYDYDREKMEPRKAPTVETLESAVRELTVLKSVILKEPDYEKINKSRREKGREERSPLDTLKTYIKSGIPCIVRKPGHIMVARGFKASTDEIMFNDPVAAMGRRTISSEKFEEDWGKKDPKYPTENRHLLLAIFPPWWRG